MSIQEIVYLSEILGREVPGVKRMLQQAYLRPEKAHIIQKHMLYLLRNKGYDLTDLPLFSLNLPENVDESGISAGNVIFGNENTRKLYLSTDSFAGHTLVSGQTKIGKSTLVKHFIPQFVKKGIAVWIFDCENEYKSLLKSVDPDEIYVLDAANDRDNFLEPPPLTGPEEWKGKWRNVLREMWLREGGINLIDDIFGNLYKNSGVFSGSENYPAIADVMNLLRSIQFKSGSRYSMYHESVINRFGGLHDNLKCLRCRKGYDIRRFLEEKKCVVFNTRGLSDDIRHFYINLKTLRVMTYLEKLPPQGLRLLLIIDEAHKLYNKEIAKKYDLGEPMVFSNARTFAKRGIACVYLDQIPSELPPALFGNVNNRFIMRLGNGYCIRRVARAANLNNEQSDQIPLLPLRRCLIHSGDYPYTALFEIPELRFDYVSDDDVASHMEEILPSLEYTPATEELEVSSGEEKEEEGLDIPGLKKGKSQMRPNRLWTETAKILAEMGWISLSSLYANLGNVSPWYGRKILKEMENQDMIELCPISFGTRGNPKTFVVLKAKGAEFIGVDFDDIRLQGKGSAEHVILQNLIAEGMKDSGKTVTVEHHINGKSVDIAEIREDKSIAYEIELSPAHQHVVENVLRDLDAGFDEVVVITRNQTAQNEAKDKIYKNIPWEKISKVKFKLFREFL